LFLSLRNRIRTEELDEFMELFEFYLISMRILACVPIYCEKISIWIDFKNATWS
jgi:hypothetical protein